MTRGVVFGKFYPVHAGHQHLIETALSKVDLLTVVVTAKKGQKIPGSIRAHWLREMYPGVNVKSILYDIADDDDEAWVAITPSLIGYKPDLVFTAGMHWAYHYSQLIGAKHIVVEGGRTKFPISGTEIRANPELYLKFLHPIVRKYFEAKIYEAELKGEKYKINETIL